MNPVNRNAFTLVELSIVLVILGLLTGGILTGQSLIRAAELRSVTVDVGKYQSAVYAFREKYRWIPGDITNATSFWGAEPLANCPGTEATPSTTTATCNGNGNGRVSEATTANVGVEQYRFWQHLANAGLIEGSYTGVRARNGQPWSGTAGVNLPRTKMSNTGWGVYSSNNVGGGQTENYALDFGPVSIRFGVDESVDDTGPYQDALSPEEAWNIDTKTDDGKPGRGRVSASQVTDCTTSTNNLDFAGDYDFMVTGRVCGLTVLFQK